MSSNSRNNNCQSCYWRNVLENTPNCQHNEKLDKSCGTKEKQQDKSIDNCEYCKINHFLYCYYLEGYEKFLISKQEHDQFMMKTLGEILERTKLNCLPEKKGKAKRSEKKYQTSNAPSLWSCFRWKSNRSTSPPRNQQNACLGTYQCNCAEIIAKLNEINTRLCDIHYRVCLKSRQQTSCESESSLKSECYYPNCSKRRGTSEIKIGDGYQKSRTKLGSDDHCMCKKHKKQLSSEDKFISGHELRKFGNNINYCVCKKHKQQLGSEHKRTSGDELRKSRKNIDSCVCKETFVAEKLNKTTSDIHICYDRQTAPDMFKSIKLQSCKIPMPPVGCTTPSYSIYKLNSCNKK